MKKVYLAIPYTRMEESSYEQATLATHRLLERGINVFSPITHCHPLTKFDDRPLPGTWDFWSQVDYQFIDWADEVYVLIPEEGYDAVLNSTGVQAEIAYATENNVPIKFLHMVKGEIAYTVESVA